MLAGVLVAGMVAASLLVPWWLAERHRAPAPSSAGAPAPAHPAFEDFAHAPPGPPAPPPAPPAPPAARRGLVLVMDDVGYGRRAVERLFALPGPIAVAVLPGAPFARLAAARAHARGWPVLLHLPMEPRTPRYRARMDDHFLRLGMDAARIRATIAADLAWAPGAIGANNHMGSAFTEDAAGMSVVLETLAARGLFFLDSLTTPRSTAARLGRALGVPVLVRDLFLDHDPTPAGLARAWRRALSCARRRACIVIAHPHPQTIAFLHAHLTQASPNLLALDRLAADRRTRGG